MNIQVLSEANGKNIDLDPAVIGADDAVLAENNEGSAVTSNEKEKYEIEWNQIEMKQSWISFEIFPGRLNNQLITLDWVFRTSMAFNRTVFIEDPLHDQTWLGIGLGRSSQVLWDVEELQRTFRVAFEEDFILIPGGKSEFEDAKKMNEIEKQDLEKEFGVEEELIEEDDNSKGNLDRSMSFLNFFERELKIQLELEGISTKLLNFKKDERIQKIIAKARERALVILKKPPSEIPAKCIYNPEVKNVVKFMKMANISPECNDRIHFQTGGGLVHPWKSDTRIMNINPMVFWRALRPAKYLIDEAIDFINNRVRIGKNEHATYSRGKSKIVGQLNGDLKTKVVAVHTRAHNSYLEPPPAPKSYARCDRIAEKLRTAAENHVIALGRCCKSFNDKVKNGDLALPGLEISEKSALELLGWTPEMSESERNAIVNRIYVQKKMKDMCHLTPHILNLSQKVGVNENEGLNNVILCTDKELPDVDKMFYDAGAISYLYSPKTFNHKRDTNAAVANKDEWRRLSSLIVHREEVLMDMLIMTFSDIFIGAPSSTLSFVVCMWRQAWRGMKPDVIRDGHYQPQLDMVCPMAILATGTSDCETIHCSS